MPSKYDMGAAMPPRETPLSIKTLEQRLDEWRAAHKAWRERCARQAAVVEAAVYLVESRRSGYELGMRELVRAVDALLELETEDL